MLKKCNVGGEKFDAHRGCLIFLILKLPNWLKNSKIHHLVKHILQQSFANLIIII